MASHDTMCRPFETGPSPPVPGAVVSGVADRSNRSSLIGAETLDGGPNALRWGRHGGRRRLTLPEADPERDPERTRSDHNRVRDIPFSVSVLGLAPPPPSAERDWPTE